MIFIERGVINFCILTCRGDRIINSLIFIKITIESFRLQKSLSAFFRKAIPGHHMNENSKKRAKPTKETRSSKIKDRISRQRKLEDKEVMEKQEMNSEKSKHDESNTYPEKMKIQPNIVKQLEQKASEKKTSQAETNKETLKEAEGAKEGLGKSKSKKKDKKQKDESKQERDRAEMQKKNGQSEIDQSDTPKFQKKYSKHKLKRLQPFSNTDSSFSDKLSKQEVKGPSSQPSQPMIDETTPVEPSKPRSSLRQSKSKIQSMALQSHSEEQEELPPISIEDIQESVLTSKIQCLLWKQVNENEQKWLAKFYGRSHLHCKWFSKEELKEINFDLSHSAIKSLGVRMRRTINLKLKQNHFFNPNFTKPDRIVGSSEQITSISHKLATDIKGHWLESVYLVCSKMLNFVKNQYPYCVHFFDCLDEDQEKMLAGSKSISISKVFNKILMGRYKDYKSVWKDIGTALNSYLSVFSKPDNDLNIIGQTMKEASIFLYLQWHRLSRERYYMIRMQKINKGLLEQTEDDEEYYQNYNIPVMCSIKGQSLDLSEKYFKENILIHLQTNDDEEKQEFINRLHPGDKNFVWLDTNSPPQMYQAYEFKYLTPEDLSQLNLNESIDKLYLVKWKDLSYAEMTWQVQSDIVSPEKIQQFYCYNKYPNKDTERLLQKQLKMHRSLLQFSEKRSEKVNPEPMGDKLKRFQNQLYYLGVKEERKQYGGTNIPIYKNYRKLKEFQLESLNWMVGNWHQNRNYILADEMGLGKTIQTIAFLYHLHNHEKMTGPFLVLAPLTTLHQWRREIEEWTNFNCLLYYDQGNSQMREIIRNTEFNYTTILRDGDLAPSELPKFQVLLTNYEIFIKDFDILKNIAFQHIILDEAHRLKNKSSKITSTLNKLPCYRKTLLTGTPIQNNTKELWTLLNFIEPDIFNSEEEFQQKYGILENDDQVKAFRKELKPYLLRRIKEDVETTIPKLSQLIISVQMTSEQKKYYRGLLQKNKKEMIRGLNNANFNSISIQLRKCCNHPYLIAPEIEDELKKGCKNHEQQSETFMKSSGKVILLLKLLEKFKKEGKKVLVFSQFVMLLDLIKPFLQYSHFNCEILKGSQSSIQRHQAISRFNEESNKTDVFLLSTKAGGVGINLISASEVIIFDSDWNPQNDIQATARAHRIGQKKEVTVYRLITANSYESEMFKISSKKLGLDRAVFTGEYFSSSNNSVTDEDKVMSKQEIEILLKKGILGFLENENENEEYFNQSIEDILEKNSKKIEYSTVQSTFAKTTFKVEQEKEGISIDAPDFWQRALRNVETPLDKLVNKTNLLKDYDTIQKQQQIMIEAYQVCYVFVKQKTINVGFNAQDQYNLNKFFRAVQNQRGFHKKYRQLSNDFIDQIDKPSRRFRVKLENLYILNPTIDNAETENKESEHSSETEQMPQKIDEEVKFQALVRDRGQNEDDELRSFQNFQKLCYGCWRPKCIYFCKGPCGRCYHKKCWQKSQENNNGRPPLPLIVEKDLSFDAWSDQAIFSETCFTCQSQNFNFDCSICLRNGPYDAMINENKEKYKKFASVLDGEMVFKCNMRSCKRYFHLRCLFSEQYEGRFADKAGKVMKNIKEKSIIFRCPAHYCYACYGKDYQLSKSRPVTCSICCMTFHLKCLSENQFTKIRKSTYICSKHLNKKQDFDLVQEMKWFTEKKESRKYIKDKKLSIEKRIQILKERKALMDQQKIQNPTVNNAPVMSELKEEKNEQDKKEQKFTFGYKHFGLTPILDFDFESYKGNWCRYCGSRFTKMFKKGPWGMMKLCYHHFVTWKKKKTLNLNKYKKEPREPIDKGRNTEIKYLNLMQKELNLQPVSTVLRLKEMMREEQELEHEKQKKRGTKKQVLNQELTETIPEIVKIEHPALKLEEALENETPINQNSNLKNEEIMNPNKDAKSNEEQVCLQSQDMADMVYDFDINQDDYELNLILRDEEQQLVDESIQAYNGFQAESTPADAAPSQIIQKHEQENEKCLKIISSPEEIELPPELPNQRETISQQDEILGSAGPEQEIDLYVQP